MHARGNGGREIMTSRASQDPPAGDLGAADGIDQREIGVEALAQKPRSTMPSAGQGRGRPCAHELRQVELAFVHHAPVRGPRLTKSLHRGRPEEPVVDPFLLLIGIQRMVGGQHVDAVLDDGAMQEAMRSLASLTPDCTR